ncbi:N-6 DNA methylase, partial [Streptomyces durocortorensis]
MPENATEVTAAGIARLAGVGRAAVSNWRRRYADFPQPVGGTGTSPSFALSEVEQWLRDQGKLAEVPLRERVWQAVAGHPAGAGRALIHVGCALLLVRDRPTAWLELAGAPDERMAALLPQAMEHVLTARLGPEANGGHGAGAPELAGVHTAGAHKPVGADVADSPESARVHTASPPEPVRAHGAGSPESARVHTPTTQELLPSVPLLRAAAELAAGIGAGQAFEFLLGRQLDANPRQYTLTPPQLAELMVDLAEPPKCADRAAREQPVRSVLDPAAGTGALLRAVGGPAALYAQEVDPALAALTALRLALATEGPRRAADGTQRPAPGPAVRTGDTLRADAFPELAADTVLCHPPFNERNWGHDELAYDPRWEYGLPARTESELAWVQHVLARLRDGGTAVLLMPPAAASRRSGRRIRAGLLRRGALRAVIALPAGAAPPYGIPLHLWILCKPEPGVRPAADLLLADTADLSGPAPDASASPGRPPGGKAAGGKTAGGGRERFDWPAVRSAVLDAWRDRADVEGVSRVVPVIELLDEDVDLAPARHLPRPASGGGASGLGEVRDRLTETLRLTTGLVPPAAAPP